MLCSIVRYREWILHVPRYVMLKIWISADRAVCKVIVLVCLYNDFVLLMKNNHKKAACSKGNFFFHCLQ